MRTLFTLNLGLKDACIHFCEKNIQKAREEDTGNIVEIITDLCNI